MRDKPKKHLKAGACLFQVMGDRFRSSVCMYEEYARSATADTENARNTHEEAPNVSASIIACAKRCLVKYTVLQRIVVFA